MRSRSAIPFTALSALTAGLFLLDLAVGAVRIPVADVWAALTDRKSVGRERVC